MKVLIIDYGMGNVGSVKRAIEECGINNVIISNEYNDFDDCTHAILPGVGAFPDAIKNLEKFGLINKIKTLALEDKIPILGICLGMQLLASQSVENSFQKGLNLIPGSVELFFPKNQERVPHVGWNEIHFQESSHSILNNIHNKSDFYFVHSYHFIPKHSEHILTQTPYCGNFVSMVKSDNIIGAQFHPEKSSTTGFQLLKNFLNF